MANEANSRKEGWVGNVEMSFVSNDLMHYMNKGIFDTQVNPKLHDYRTKSNYTNIYARKYIPDAKKGSASQMEH